MIEEAEKNASLDKLKKALVSIIYELDNVFTKSEFLANSIAFTNTKNENVRHYFLQILTNIKSNYTNNQLKPILIDLIPTFEFSHEVVVFDFIQSKLRKKQKIRKSSVIDIGDDVIDV